MCDHRDENGKKFHRACPICKPGNYLEWLNIDLSSNDPMSDRIQKVGNAERWIDAIARLRRFNPDAEALIKAQPKRHFINLNGILVTIKYPFTEMTELQ